MSALFLAPHALAYLCFCVLFFFSSSAAWTMWYNTPITLQTHTHTHTNFSLYSPSGNFITQISSLDSPGGTLINSHFTPFVLSQEEWEYCCRGSTKCACVCSQADLWFTIYYSEGAAGFGRYPIDDSLCRHDFPPSRSLYSTLYSPM